MESLSYSQQGHSLSLGQSSLQPASVLGLRTAIMAVLRQCALQSLAEILSFHQSHRRRLALKTWFNSVRQKKLHHEHAWTAAEASRASSRLAEKHDTNVAQLRKEWKHARQALMQENQQNELSDEEIHRLRDLDKSYRRQMAEMHDSHEELQGEHRSAHAEAQTMCKKNIKVLAMGVLESLAESAAAKNAQPYGDDWPDQDSPSVCFMQWAFTPNPEAWCPLPPARDLKHAMVLSEQRSQLAAALRQLHRSLRQLPRAATAAAASARPGATAPKAATAPLAARLFRRVLQQILWRQLGGFFRKLMALRPDAPVTSAEPRSQRGVARRSFVAAEQRAVDGGPSVRRSAFFLGEDFADVQRSPPSAAHELHGTGLREHKGSTKTAAVRKTAAVSEDAAALKIQSAERGRRARKSVKTEMQAAMSPPVASEWTDAVRGEVVEQPPPSLPRPAPSHLPDLPPVPVEVRAKAASKIQAHFRGRQGRKMANQQRKKVFSRRSALKLIAAKPQSPAQPRQSPVQSPKQPLPVDADNRRPSKAAAVPRHMAPRRSASAKRPDAALEDEPSPEEASLGHLPPVPPEVLHAAAVKIQSAARGHQSRRRVAATRAQHRETVPESVHGEDAEEEDLESDEEYQEARRVTHLGPALTE